MTTAEGSVAHLLELAGDGLPRPAIAFALGLLADGATPRQIIVDLLAPVQREVGVRWQTNRWSVADEHAATAVIDGVLGALSLENAVRGPRRGEVLVACAEGEHHTMPARMGVEILRSDGWDVTFLGGSLPADDLQRFAAEREPELVLVSCTVPLTLSGARRCFVAVDEVGLPAIAVGAAFGHDDARARRLGARGWLAPVTSLAALLDAGLPPHCEVPPTPPEARDLELDGDSLQAACLSLMVERVPAMATYTPAQWSSTRKDLSYIFGFLTIAVDLADDEIFDSFTGWLAGVLGARHVPSSVLDQSLQCIAEVLEGADLPQAAGLCAAHRGTPMPGLAAGAPTV